MTTQAVVRLAVGVSAALLPLTAWNSARGAGQCPAGSSQSTGSSSTGSGSSTGTSSTGSSSTTSSSSASGRTGNPQGPTVLTVPNMPTGSLPPGLPTSRPSVDIPAADPQAAEAAKSEARAARADLGKAQSALAAATRRLQKEFDARPDVVQAAQEIAATKAAFDAAAAPVLASLGARADYAAAESVAAQAQQQVNEMRGRSDVTLKDRLAAAQTALAAKDTVTKMLNQAFTSAPQVAAAKANYAAAIAALARLRLQYDELFPRDPQRIAAKETLDGARARAAKADQELAAALRELARQQAARAAAIAQQQRLDRQLAAHQPPRNQ